MMKSYTLITGATSGLGFSTAETLSKTKDLILVGRSEKKFLDLKHRLGGQHLFFCCDLEEIDAVANLLSSFLSSNHAVVDKLIHCAGVDQTLPVKALNARKIDLVMRVNFYSVVEIVRVLLKKSVNHSMLSNIIFVSSISSIRGYRAKAAYSASKAALDAYMRVLSKELAPNVSVNSILPGAVPTPMSKAEFDNPALKKHFQEAYPMGIGSVEQVVSLIKTYHDLDDLWVTGQQIVVDGGVTS